MSDKPIVVDLGWCVARYSKDFTGTLPGLSIASPTDYSRKDIVPATSVFVKADYCPALRDFLLEHFPVEKPIGTVVGPGAEPGTIRAEIDICEIIRKAAAYDAAAYRAKSIRCERPVSTASSRFVDDFASGAFLKEVRGE